MMKHALLAAALLASVASFVYAEEDMHADKQGHQWTLEEARKHAHERADELDKMTPKEFAERQKKHQEWKEKWKNMTPAQRAEHEKKHAEWKEKWDKMTQEEKDAWKKKRAEWKERKEEKSEDKSANTPSNK